MGSVNMYRLLAGVRGKSVGVVFGMREAFVWSVGPTNGVSVVSVSLVGAAHPTAPFPQGGAVGWVNECSFGAKG